MTAGPNDNGTPTPGVKRLRTTRVRTEFPIIVVVCDLSHREVFQLNDRFIGNLPVDADVVLHHYRDAAVHVALDLCAFTQKDATRAHQVAEHLRIGTHFDVIARRQRGIDIASISDPNVFQAINADGIRIAQIADAVAITVELIGIRHQPTVVDAVGDAVVIRVAVEIIGPPVTIKIIVALDVVGNAVIVTVIVVASGHLSHIRKERHGVGMRERVDVSVQKCAGELKRVRIHIAADINGVKTATVERKNLSLRRQTFGDALRCVGQ